MSNLDVIDHFEFEGVNPERLKNFLRRALSSADRIIFDENAAAHISREIDLPDDEDIVSAPRILAFVLASESLQEVISALTAGIPKAEQELTPQNREILEHLGLLDEGTDDDADQGMLAPTDPEEFRKFSIRYAVDELTDLAENLLHQQTLPKRAHAPAATMVEFHFHGHVMKFAIDANKDDLKKMMIELQTKLIDNVEPTRSPLGPTGPLGEPRP